MKLLYNAMAAIAIILSLAFGAITVQTNRHLERIDDRLDGITRDIGVLKSPDYLDHRLDDALDRVLAAMRAEQMQRLAKAQ